MKYAMTIVLSLSLFAAMSVFVGLALAEDGKNPPDKASTEREVSKAAARRIRENAPATVAEARGRARMLHETLHGSLQVMHRDFFREDEGLKIPSRSLEDVFREMARSYGVRLHWIAVGLKAMSVENEPKTEFEKEAARIISSGKEEYESVAGDEFRFAGKIRLSATCLGCHASRRSRNDDRSAGLVIIMPLKSDFKPKKN